MNASFYLDHHTETKPCRSALDRWNMQPSSAETDFLYDLVGAHKEDLFVFTSSNAEAIQQVFWSLFIERSRKEGKSHFLTTCLEDAPTLLGMKRLEELGCFVRIAPCDQRGCIDLKALAHLLNPRTALVSITLAQGLTGVVQPLEEISQLCREHGTLLHVDATYAVGKLPLQLGLSDYLTFSGDRMHGVKGSAALFAKSTAPLVPLLPGKNTDFASLSALNAAAQQAKLSMHLMGLEVARLRDRLEQGILAEIAGARVLFSESLRLPNVSVIAFPHLHQETFLHRLHGDATIGGDNHPHLYRILMSAGFDERTAVSCISFSLSRTTTQEEVDRAIRACKEVYLERSHYAGSFSQEDAETRSMRLAIGRVGSPNDAIELALYWLVDPSDGVIADAKFQAFGPPLLLDALDVACELLIRKNYDQASRFSVDLIQHRLKNKPDASFLNKILDAIDLAVGQCLDLPFASSHDQTPIEKTDGEFEGILGWEHFSNEEKLKTLEEIVEQEIRPYIELDAGGIHILGVKNSGEVRISYQGACTSCHSSTGSTLSAIQRILRTHAHPSLSVIVE